MLLGNLWQGLTVRGTTISTWYIKCKMVNNRLMNSLVQASTELIYFGTGVDVGKTRFWFCINASLFSVGNDRQHWMQPFRLWRKFDFSCTRNEYLFRSVVFLLLSMDSVFFRRKVRKLHLLTLFCLLSYMGNWDPDRPSNIFPFRKQKIIGTPKFKLAENGPCKGIYQLT
jgi:hypothetical protein